MKGESHEGRRWIGRVLRGRWRIDARISRGGVGTVYAATHKNNGSRAAIKVLHPEFSRDADTRSRFLQEGYAANQVNHPGVVRILDDDTSEEGHAYLVMELLEGELLETRRIRKGGRLALMDVYEVGEQLLDVLSSAHDKGIVHRDIKPDNLFVTQEGRLKVLDFGFAQMRSQFRPDITATGFLLGTPGFMSPEQAVGNRAQVDAQTDIWAVGATLFTLISGEPVHEGESAAAMLVAAANFQPRSLAAVTTGLPMRLVEVVDRAVAFDKADRWPSARSMQLALRAVSGKERAGAVSRRSIPDVEPVSDGPTLYEDPMFIEELDPSELVDSQSADWKQGTQHPDDDGLTIVGPPHAALSEGPVTKPPATVKMGPQTKPPTTPQIAAYPAQPQPQPRQTSAAPAAGPPGHSGTHVMDAMRERTGSSGSYPSLGNRHVSAAPLRPFAPSTHPPPAPDVRSPRGQQGAPYAAFRAAPAAHYRRGPSRPLVLMGVVIVTMVIVVVAGLLILTFSD